MISALAWVPRGAAKPVIDEAELADAELDSQQVSRMARALFFAPLCTYTDVAVKFFSNRLTSTRSLTRQTAWRARLKGQTAMLKWTKLLR